MDFYSIMKKQINFSKKTFGKGIRTLALMKHIEKEIQELLEDFKDNVNPVIPEDIDILILVLDNLWRKGYTPFKILNLLNKKIDINIKRKWNTNVPENMPIEHIR